MASTTRNDDYLSFGDALRGLDSWDDPRGELVRVQEVFDVLAHRDLLDSPRNDEPQPDLLEQMTDWLVENKYAGAEDPEAWDELARTLSAARVLRMAPGTTFTAILKDSAGPLHLMVVRSAQGLTWLAGADGVDRRLTDIDLSNITRITPPA